MKKFRLSKYIDWQIWLAIIMVVTIFPFASGIPASASNVTTAEFQGIITISNNSTANSTLVTSCSINTTAFIDADYINSNVTNVAIQDTDGNDVAFMPGYGGNNWTLWVDSIDADSYMSYLMYTGQGVTGGKDAFFPQTGGNLTTSDDPSMEPGSDQFSLDIAGWIDTDNAADKYIMYKGADLSLYVDPTQSGNITANFGGVTTEIDNIDSGEHDILMYRDYAIYQSQLGVDAPYIEMPNDAIFAPNTNDFTISMWVNFTGFGTWRGLYYSNNPGVSSHGIMMDAGGSPLRWFISPGVMLLEDHSAFVADTWYNFIFRRSGNDFEMFVDGVSRNSTTLAVAVPDPAFVYFATVDWVGHNPHSGRMAHIRWLNRAITAGEIVEYQQCIYSDDTDLGMFLKCNEGTGTTLYDSSGNGVNGVCTNAQYDWLPSFLGQLSVDGVLADPVVKIPDIPNNADDWVSCMNGAVRYLEHQTISLDGTEVHDIDQFYGATFLDLSGYNNDATPNSPMTTTEDADIIGILNWFIPLGEAIAPEYSITTAPDFITTTPGLAGNFSTSPPGPSFPGADVITALAAASSTPVQLPYALLFGFIILAVSVVLSWMMKRFGSNSIMVKTVAIGVMLGIFIGVGVFDFWMLIVFAIPAIALCMASRQQGW